MLTNSTAFSTQEKRPVVVGIDLGTTNSAMAIVRSGNTPSMIRLKNNKVTMPSCIYWKGKPGEFIVGDEAYQNRYKKSACYSVKRLMGSGKEVTLQYGRKEITVSPAFVSSLIIKELLKDIEFKNITHAVVTVPAHFDNLQIDDTQKAVEMAGLQLIEILREPTSASLAFGMNLATTDNKAIIVYDLGGGTFDASAVRMTYSGGEGLGSLYGDDSDDGEGKWIYSVITTDGDTKLGGDDIDKEMYKILERYMAEKGIDLKRITKEEKESLILNLEACKKGGIGGYVIPISGRDKKGNKLNTSVEITAQDFYDAARVVYRKTKEILDRVVAKVGADQVGKIVLVGGSTKSEAIRSFLARDYKGVEIHAGLNPDEAVALGAGIVAKKAMYGDDTVEIFDVLPIDIGVESAGVMSPIIHRDTRVPCSENIQFTTQVDNQTRVRVKIFQGNSRYIDQCQHLGDVVIDNIPPGPAGSFEGTIIQNVDSAGHLTCEVVTPLGRKKVELVSLFRKSEVQEATENKDRALDRWRHLVDRISADQRPGLTAILDRYENKEVSKKEVVEYIRGINIEETAKTVKELEDSRISTEEVEVLPVEE